MTEEADRYTQCHAEVCALLNRDFSIDPLLSLTNAMRFELDSAVLSETVIAFDANVLLRLSSHARSEDIVDYLRTAFPGRIILPGQVVQEFWNNQFQAVATVSASVRKKLDELATLVESIDSRYGEFHGRFTQLVDEFRDSYGYVFDENLTRKTKSLVELLQEKASVPYMPRNMLAATAMFRKRTKTPPGFKDDADGDFYVWSDLLLGIAYFKRSSVRISRVTLVTLEKKIDWSREGVPHPILSAEIKAMCDAKFETLTVDGLARRLLD